MSTERERFVAFLAELELRLEKAVEMRPRDVRLRSELVYLLGMVQGGRETLERTP